MILQGACHCEAVKWNLNGAVDGITACNCTVCSRYGALWAYGYEGEEIHVTGETKTYARGRQNLSFHFCSNCGCVAYWRLNKTDENGKRRIAVNARLVDDPKKIADIPIDHFEGLDTFEDLPRDARCVKDMWF